MQSEAFDSVLEDGDVEIDQQSQRNVGKFHVGECLGRVHRCQRCHGFQMAAPITAPVNSDPLISVSLWLSRPAVFKDPRHRLQGFLADVVLDAFAVDGRGLGADAHRFQKTLHDLVPLA